MAKTRAMKCECGGKMVPKVTHLDDFDTEALICDSCGEVTFTMKQLKRALDLKRMQRALESNRKIIKIGNSLGLTLPEELGIKVGDLVRLKALTEKTFEVEFLSAGE